MVAVHDCQAEITRRRDEIKSRVENHDLTQAIKRLLDYTRDFSKDRENEAIAISFQHNRIRDEQRRCLRPAEDIDTELRRIVMSVLDLVDRLSEASLNLRSPEPFYSEPVVAPPVLHSNATLGVSSKTPKGTHTAFELAHQEYKHKKSVPHQIVFECRNLQKSFTKADDRFELSGVSLTVRPGEIIGVIGVNGAGKTTLLRIIAGELEPTSGSCSYPLLADEFLNWPVIRDQISYVQQSPYPWRGRLLDNLHLHGSFHGLYGNENVEWAGWLIQRLGLDKFRDAEWTEISSGYKMRFELAKALMAKPKLLILDEPLAPLDIFSQQLFIRDLRDLADSIQNPLSIIVTSQHLYEIEAIADTLLFLDGGKPIFCGAPAKIGSGRTTNIYEIAFPPTSAVSYSKLYEMLQNITGIRVEEHGFQFTLHTSREVSTEDVLNLIATSGYHLQYFRDVTHSSRVLFANLQEML